MVHRARGFRDCVAAPLSACSAAGRPARPYGTLPGRARPQPLAVPAALLPLSLGGDRQPRGRSLSHPAREAARAGSGGEAGRAAHPAADRRRLPLGCARGTWQGAAHGLLRASVHLRISIPVRLREFRTVGRASVPGAWTLAASWPARKDRPQELAVRADLARRLFLPHLWLGAVGPDVLFGRGGTAARPRPLVVASRDRGRAAHGGHDPADPRDADLARRDARRPNHRLVQLEGEMAVDLFGAARPLEMVRYRLADRARGGVRLRRL